MSTINKRDKRVSANQKPRIVVSRDMTPDYLAVTGERTPAREHQKTIDSWFIYQDKMEAKLRVAEAQRDEAVAALKNLVDRDLIKDKEGDHMDEIRAAIANAEGSK